MTEINNKRLRSDIKDIVTNPLHSHGIHYIPNETNMTEGYLCIVGTEDTPYFGGYYLFKFTFPNTYPFEPPDVKFLTNDGITRYNPNLYKDDNGKGGRVCVSLLNTWSGEQWTACQNIRSVALAMCTLLNNKPLLNEPGVAESHPDLNNYSQIIKFKNLEFAVCSLLLNPTIIPHCSLFYDIMVEHFLKNYDKLMEVVAKGKEDYPTEELLCISAYNGMNTKINYDMLEHKLRSVKEKLDNEAAEAKAKAKEEAATEATEAAEATEAKAKAKAKEAATEATEATEAK